MVGYFELVDTSEGLVVTQNGDMGILYITLEGFISVTGCEQDKVQYYRYVDKDVVIVEHLIEG